MSLFPSSLNSRQQAELGPEWSVEILVAPVDGHVSSAALATQYPLAVSCDDQTVERRATTRPRDRVAIGCNETLRPEYSFVPRYPRS